MRRTVLGLATTLTVAVAASLFAVSGARASTGAVPTLNGPSVGRYYAVATLTGTTASPTAPVTLHIRNVGTSAWRTGRTVRSTASAQFAISFRLTSNVQYYVDAAGVASRVLTTRVVTASCTVGKALFTALPFPRSPHSKSDPYDDFALASAYRNGLWAGVIYRNFTGDFYVYSFRAGHPRTILARYRYRHSPYGVPTSVRVVGIVPGNDIVAEVQDPKAHAANLAAAPVRGVYWAGRKGHYLSHASTWRSWSPVSLTDSGMVVGWADAGTPSHPHYYAVSWSRVTARYRVVADLGSSAAVVADRSGDIAWAGRNGYAVVRTTDGAVHELRSAPLTTARYVSQFITPTGASLHSIFASGQDGITEWRIPAHLPAGPLVDHGLVSGFDSGTTFVDDVGRRGDLLIDVSHASLLTAKGARVRVPSMFTEPTDHAQVLTDSGRLAFTSAKDRRVHVMTCH